MRGALLVCKKEFLELGKDRKTLFFTFVLPLLLYPLLFGMIGKLNKNDEAKRQGRSRAVAALGDEDRPVFSESQRLGLSPA